MYKVSTPQAPDMDLLKGAYKVAFSIKYKYKVLNAHNNDSSSELCANAHWLLHPNKMRSKMTFVLKDCDFSWKVHYTIFNHDWCTLIAKSMRFSEDFDV